MQIRKARPEEYDLIGALTVAGYAADDLLRRADGSDDHYEAVLRDAAGRAEVAELMVAVDPGPGSGPQHLLGTLTWCPAGSPLRELADAEDQGEFRMLSVAPDQRGRGVGRALTRWCVDRARADGLREIWLCSLPQMVKAHALYHSLGFVRVPERDAEPYSTVVLWAFRLVLR